MRGLVGATVLLITSRIFAYYLKKILPDYISTILYWFEPFAIVLAAATLYGALGWKIQTFSGESQEEKSNRLFLKVFLSLSYFLGITVLFLK